MSKTGHRSALVLSPQCYNRTVGMVILCPFTNQVKGHPFEVRIPEGLKTSGAVLADQVKSMDWRARRASWLCRVPDGPVREVLSRVGTRLNV